MEVNRLEVYKKMFAPPTGWDKTKAEAYQNKLIHKGQLESKNVPDSFPFLAFYDRFWVTGCVDPSTISNEYLRQFNCKYQETDDVLLKRGNKIASLLNQTDPFSFDALEKVVNKMSGDIPYQKPDERLKQKVYVPGPREEIDTTKVTDHVGIHMTISTDYDQFKQLMENGPTDTSVQAMFVSPNGDVTAPSSLKDLYIMIKFAGIKLLRRIDLQIYDAKQTLKDKARRDLKLYLEGKPSSVGRGRFNNALEKAKTLGYFDDTYTYKGKSSVFGFRPIVTKTERKSESEWLLLGIVHDDEVLEELSPALKQNFGYNMWKLWVQRKTQATLKYLNRADTDRSSIDTTKITGQPAYISDMPTYYGPGNTPRYAQVSTTQPASQQSQVVASQSPASQQSQVVASQSPASQVASTCKEQFIAHLTGVFKNIEDSTLQGANRLYTYFPTPERKIITKDGDLVFNDEDSVNAYYIKWRTKSGIGICTVSEDDIVTEAIRVLTAQAEYWDDNLAVNYLQNKSPWRNYTVKDLANNFSPKLELTDDDLTKLEDNGITTLEQLKNLPKITISLDELMYEDKKKYPNIANFLEQALSDWYKEEIKYSRGKCVTDGQQVGIIVSNTGNAVTVNFFPEEVTLFRTIVEPATDKQCETAKLKLSEQIENKKKVEQELISKQQEKEAKKIRKEREEYEEGVRKLEAAKEEERRQEEEREAAVAKAKITLTLDNGFLINSDGEKIFQVVDQGIAQNFMITEGFESNMLFAKYLKTSETGTAFSGVGHDKYQRIKNNNEELYLRECGKPITELTEEIIEQAKQALLELHEAGLHHTKIDPSKLIMHGGKLKLVVDEYHTIKGSKEIIGGIQTQTSDAFEEALTRSKGLLFHPHVYEKIQITPLLIGQDKANKKNLPWLFVDTKHGKVDQEKFIKTIDKWMLAVSLLLISNETRFITNMFGEKEYPSLFYRAEGVYQIFRKDVVEGNGSNTEIIADIIGNDKLEELKTDFGITAEATSVLDIMEQWIRKHYKLGDPVLERLYGIEGKLVKKIFEPLCDVLGGCKLSTRVSKPRGAAANYDSYSDEELHELADLSDYELEDMITDVLGYDSSSDSGAPLSYDSSSDNAQLSYNSESAYGSESAGYNSESDAD